MVIKLSFLYYVYMENCLKFNLHNIQVSYVYTMGGFGGYGRYFLTIINICFTNSQAQTQHIELTFESLKKCFKLIINLNRNYFSH